MIIESILVFLLYFIGAFLLFLIVNAVGPRMASQYRDILTDMNDSERSFNAIYRIVAPVVIWCLFASLLKLLGISIGVESFSVFIFYWIIRLASLFLFNKIRRGYLLGFFWRVVASCLLGYYFTFNIISVDANLLIPETSDVVFQFWLVFALAIVSVVSRAGSQARYDFEKQFHEIRRLANGLLPKRFKEDFVLQALFYSFATIEDYYRPSPIRRMERLAHRFGLAETTGIMQVKSSRPLSDKESILASVPIIEDIWDDYLKKSKPVGDLEHFTVKEGSYSYRFGELLNQVRVDFDSIHANYMGTVHFNGVNFFNNASFYIRCQDYISDESEVIVETSRAEIC
ncbi:MAG: hypothetical protein LBL23_05000 [Coriobacteriales bacterium]|jgi:hypothetical protein|nr:hypothetical protein [Coriobacteriales bacterium]